MLGGNLGSLLYGDVSVMITSHEAGIVTCHDYISAKIVSNMFLPEIRTCTFGRKTSIHCSRIPVVHVHAKMFV